MTDKSRRHHLELAQLAAALPCVGFKSVAGVSTFKRRVDAASYNDLALLQRSVPEVVCCGNIGASVRGSTWLQRLLASDGASCAVISRNNLSGCTTSQSNLQTLPEDLGIQRHHSRSHQSQRCMDAISNLRHSAFLGGFPCLQS